MYSYNVEDWGGKYTAQPTLHSYPLIVFHCSENMHLIKPGLFLGGCSTVTSLPTAQTSVHTHIYAGVHRALRRYTQPFRAGLIPGSAAGVLKLGAGVRYILPYERRKLPT